MGAQPPPDAAVLLTAYARSLIRHKSRELCRRPGFSRSDEPDLAQDLTLALLRKAHLYDPGRGASVDTFAGRVIDSEVKMILRARRRKKRAAGYLARSLDADPTDAAGAPGPLADALSDVDRSRRGRLATADPAAAAETAEALRHALAGLPPFEAEVARHLCECRSAASVARVMQVSRRRVRAAVEQIRRRCADAGLGPD